MLEPWKCDARDRDRRIRYNRAIATAEWRRQAMTLEETNINAPRMLHASDYL